MADTVATLAAEKAKCLAEIRRLEARLVIAKQHVDGLQRGYQDHLAELMLIELEMEKAEK